MRNSTYIFYVPVKSVKYDHHQLSHCDFIKFSYTEQNIVPLRQDISFSLHDDFLEDIY